MRSNKKSRSLMVLLDDLSRRLKLNDPEERRLIANVAWAQYEALLAELGDSPTYRVNYLDGVLEIVAPSRRHETGKSRIDNLLLIYFLATNTEYFPTGSTTFRNAEQQVGAESDESYCMGTDKDFPDLGIEVIVTSGGMNRLERFRRLGVREVWFWQNNHSIYHWREAAAHTDSLGYEAIDHSELLPDLDINLLTQCVLNPNPLAAAKAFRQGIKNQRSGIEE
jgi:Uma2 family endonuclease